MAKSKIEWTEDTWNPLTGCTVFSPGCANCYAKRASKRLREMGLPKYKNGFELTLHPDTLNDPLEWKKPRKIFVNSMSDLFHKDVPLDFIQQVFDVMGRARQHRFQVLTKRSARLLELSDQLAWAPNIWMGVSVEGENYVHRIDNLRRTGAAIKFLSVEPLLGPIPSLDLSGIDQVIVGGESGPGARPMEEDWVQAILRECRAQHVCFFFKQWGGPKKNLTGRILNGRTYDEEPGPRTHSIPEHPAAAIFAKMSEEELRRLADDIRQNGQREPIVLTQEGMILDGRNRAAACEWAGLVPLETTVWDGVPGEELQFVLSRNIHRRHLNESQRAMAAALAREMVNGIRRGGGKVVNLPPGSGTKTAEILGELFSVSEKLVRLAMPISGCPVLCEAVQSGRYKVSAVSRLVKLSPAEQRQRLDEWDKAKVRTPAATAEKDDSPPVLYWEVDLNAPETDLARPNLASDAAVVIKADCIQIGAAVDLLSKWKVPLTDVRCEHGEFQPGAILLIGGRLPETWDESAFRNGLGALQAVVAEDFVGPNTVEQDPDGCFLQSASPGGKSTLFISRSGRIWERGQDVACLRAELKMKPEDAEAILEDGAGLDAGQILDILRPEWPAIRKAGITVDNLRGVIQKVVAKGKAPESAAPAGSTAPAVGPALLPNQKQDPGGTAIAS